MQHPTSDLPKFSTLILDLGDVLFSWTPVTTTSVSPSTMKDIINSNAWFEFEKGCTSQAECYKMLIHELNLNISVGRIEEAFQQARESLQSSSPLLAVLQELKQKHGVKILAMSNISEPDYKFLRSRLDDWSMFDDIFTSFMAGKRKPDPEFFRHVIRKTSLEPRATIFVDDKIENVLAAESVGMHGIVYYDHVRLSACLHWHLHRPSIRGEAFLTAHARRMVSVTNSGIQVVEVFGQLLIWELTSNRNLTNLEGGIGQQPGKMNFFQGQPILTSNVFPCDIDTTSMAMTVGQIPASGAVHHILDEMLSYCNENGILQVYFDESRLRVDPVVCVNALTAFYAYGRAKDVEKTMQWIYRILDHRAYLNGTRYYVTPEAFLFFISRLISRSEDAHALLADLLQHRVRELIGSPGDPLALAMRILTCVAVNIRDDIDLDRLVHMQQEDGAWETGWLYKYGSSDILIGNKGVTTAFAVRAVKALEREEIDHSILP